MIFAAIILSVQLGFDNVPALHGGRWVDKTVVTLELRADANAAWMLRNMATDQQIVHVTFEVAGERERAYQMPPSSLTKP